MKRSDELKIQFFNALREKEALTLRVQSLAKSIQEAEQDEASNGLSIKPRKPSIEPLEDILDRDMK